MQRSNERLDYSYNDYKISPTIAKLLWEMDYRDGDGAGDTPHSIYTHPERIWMDPVEWTKP